MALLWVATLMAAPRADIPTTIDIAAPPHEVWSVLADDDA